MKFTWGHGISLTIFGFVAFILFMVYLSVQQDFDLVTEDYYEQELKYQGRIDDMENAVHLKDQVEWKVEKDHLRLQFPEAMLKEVTKGTIHVFRPSDDTKDMKLKLAPGDQGIQKVDLANFIPGFYRLQISWNKGGKGFYLEKEIHI